MVLNKALALVTCIMMAGGVSGAMAETAEFVDPDTDPAVYVDRYLNDEAFTEWYDTYYTGIPLHEALGISEEEYMDMVTMEDSALCGPGTMEVDGQCVMEVKSNRIEHDGLQLGTAASVGFGLAGIIVLVLWLPGRLYPRIRRRLFRS